MSVNLLIMHSFIIVILCSLPFFIFIFYYLFVLLYYLLRGFPGGSVVKNLPDNVGDVGQIPGLVRSPGEGNGNPFQYSCLGNPKDRGAWWATVHGITRESDMA